MNTKINVLVKSFCISILLVIFFSSNGITEKISVSSNQITPIFLEPSNSVVEIPFDIDVSPSFYVDVASPSDYFSVTMITPLGQTITSSNAMNFNGVYSSDLIQTPGLLSVGGSLFLVGYHYTYEIKNPVPGNWKVSITGANLPSSGEVGLVSIITQNSLKVGLLTNKSQYIVNSPVLIMATVFEGAVSLIGTSVIATIKNVTSGGVDIINLNDDGNNADNLAGDGLYSGEYVPTSPGDYSVMAALNGITNSGTSFSKEVFSSFGARYPLAYFNGSFSDQGIDTNLNSFYDYIALNLGIDVGTSGTYKVSLTLKGSNGISKTVSSIQNLTQGSNQFIPINFYKEDIYEIGVDGPYNVTEAVIEMLDNNEWYLADKKVNQWQTHAYLLNNFEKVSITLTGNNSDVAYDNNNNGKFDNLAVSIEAAILQSGSYQWSCRLVDKNNAEIEFISGSTFMNAGNNIITMTFNGQKIGKNAVDGPYYVKNLLIWKGQISLVVSQVHTTQPYLYIQFEGASQPPIAEAGGPYSGTAGSSITFNSSGSYDPDGSIVSYEWDWNNDGTYDESTTLQTITHTWANAFTGTVKLRVTDNDGLTGIDTASVAITFKGDLDGDGDVDQNDVNILLTYRNKPASACPACDLDGDGMITVLDARKLTLMCTRPRCATK